MSDWLPPEIQSMIIKLVSCPIKGNFKLYKKMVDSFDKTNDFDTILLTPFMHHFTDQRLFFGFDEDTLIDFFSALFSVLRRIGCSALPKSINFVLTIIKSFLAPMESFKETSKNGRVYITDDVKYGAIKCVFVLLRKFCNKKSVILQVYHFLNDFYEFFTFFIRKNKKFMQKIAFLI